MGGYLESFLPEEGPLAVEIVPVLEEVGLIDVVKYVPAPPRVLLVEGRGRIRKQVEGDGRPACR